MTMLGDKLMQAAAAAKAEGRSLKLPNIDGRLALCMIRTHRHPQGGLTMPADKRITGDIILGPFATRKDQATPENLDKYLQAHRWVMNRVHIGDGVSRPKYIIYGPPTISLMHRIEVSCKCGYKRQEWKDVVVMKGKRPEGDDRTSGWSKDLLLTCPRCHCTPMDQRKLRCTATLNRPDKPDDPVIDAQSLKLFQDVMVEAWAKGPPADGKPTVHLPRVWCVYEQGQCPDPAWQPDDARAKLMCERAAAYVHRQEVVDGEVKGIPYPLQLLPFGRARQYHQAPTPISTALITCWLECDAVSVGWVAMNDLYPNPDLGFKRQLWHEPLQREVLDYDPLI